MAKKGIDLTNKEKIAEITKLRMSLPIDPEISSIVRY